MVKLIKRTMLFIVFVIIFAPVLLALTEGENGEPTIINLIGLVYLSLLIAVAKLLTK